jgi:hypothetical protein
MFGTVTWIPKVGSHVFNMAKFYSGSLAAFTCLKLNNIYVDYHARLAKLQKRVFVAAYL